MKTKEHQEAELLVEKLYEGDTRGMTDADMFAYLSTFTDEASIIDKAIEIFNRTNAERLKYE